MTDLTPAQCEDKLFRLVNELTFAQSALRVARDGEVEAKHIYEAAWRRAILSDECPKVSRGELTVTERDAWVDEQVAGLRKVYDLAEVTRKSAEDHLRTVRDQSMLVMALSKSVQAAFNLAGVAS